MPNEPVWLPVEVVVEHNRLELLDTGEHHFVRDFGLLESALARPRNAFAYGEEDIVVLAVALLAGISQAHAFEQGNKRTAFAAMHFSCVRMAMTPPLTTPLIGRMRWSDCWNTD